MFKKSTPKTETPMTKEDLSRLAHVEQLRQDTINENNRYHREVVSLNRTIRRKCNHIRKLKDTIRDLTARLEKQEKLKISSPLQKNGAGRPVKYTDLGAVIIQLKKENPKVTVKEIANYYTNKGKSAPCVGTIYNVKKSLGV